MTQPAEDLPAKLQRFPELKIIDQTRMHIGIPVDCFMGNLVLILRDDYGEPKLLHPLAFYTFCGDFTDSGGMGEEGEDVYPAG